MDRKYEDERDSIMFDVLDNGHRIDDLKKVAKTFNDFDQSINSFLLKHGYKADLGNNKEKRIFIKKNFDKKGIYIENRNLDKWLQNEIMSDDSAIKFCFAFNLNLDECNEFFRTVCFRRSFDCHKIEEIVYYFAIKNSISYDIAYSITNKLIDLKKNFEYEVCETEVVYYTDFIKNEIDKFSNIDELYSYLEYNISQFQYNFMTSYKVIQELWKIISDNNGLAVKEQYYFDYLPNSKKSVDYIYSQILGYVDEYNPDSENINCTFKIKDRKIKPLLNNNDLVHKLVNKDFPNRQTILKVLNNKKNIEGEAIRKIIILLSFYKFWVEHFLSDSDFDYLYIDRCINEINCRLLECGFLELYLGNPYDWLFIYSCYSYSNKLHPLYIFRDFMRKVYLNKLL